MNEKNLLHRPLDPEQRSDKTLRMVQLAMLIAISSVLVFISFPIIPAAPFLKYDMADIPILLAAFTMGIPAGLLVLGVAAAVQAFLLGQDGPLGFLMHIIASGTLIVVAAGIYRKMKKSKKGMVIGLVCGAIAMALIMIPLNFIVTPKVVMDVSMIESSKLFFDSLFGGYDPAAYSATAIEAYNMVKGLLLPALIPFNLIKAGLNSLIFYLVFRNMPRLIKAKS
jgi:riboflavin transporter